MLTKHIQEEALELWKNQHFFKIEELVPKETYIARGNKVIELFRPEAIVSLLAIRALAKSPITVNTWHSNSTSTGFQYRGYRPASYYTKKLVKSHMNKEIPLPTLMYKIKTLALYSQHTLFNAFDFDVRGYSAEEFRMRLYEWKQEGKLPYVTGIEESVNWVHVDFRMSDRLNKDGLFLFKPY